MFGEHDRSRDRIAHGPDEPFEVIAPLPMLLDPPERTHARHLPGNPRSSRSRVWRTESSPIDQPEQCRFEVVKRPMSGTKQLKIQLIRQSLLIHRFPVGTAGRGEQTLLGAANRFWFPRDRRNRREAREHQGLVFTHHKRDSDFPLVAPRQRIDPGRECHGDLGSAIVVTIQNDKHAVGTLFPEREFYETFQLSMSLQADKTPASNRRSRNCHVEHLVFMEDPGH